MEGEIRVELIKTESSNTINLDEQEEVLVEYKKKSETPKDSQISLNTDSNETTFRLTYVVKNEFLILKLEEIGALCPFIFKRALTYNDLENIHSSFRSCKDVDEIKGHINNLFKGESIWLTKEDDKSITLNMKIGYIAKFEEIQIKLYRLMTTEKDKILNELYYIQKKGNKIFKDLEIYLKQKGLNDALDEFYRLKKKNKL